MREAEDWRSFESPGDDEAAPPLRTHVRVEHAKTIISRNDSPDIAFEQSINPYRGCEHGCIYCYARPGHSYLGMSPGLDFETRLIAKVNAAELLRRELAATGYRPKLINLGAVTDAYQPIERELGITRGVVEVLAACRHPLSIVTKASLVERDLDLLAPMAARDLASVFVSITTLDPALARIMEPRCASPERRLRTVRRLADAGVPVGVLVAPIIPFVNEPEIERIVVAAADAGARSAHYTVIRLPWELAGLFDDWLRAHFPDRAERVLGHIAAMRTSAEDAARGKRRFNDADFATRMKGRGPWADLIRQRFRLAVRRAGLSRAMQSSRDNLFVAPELPGQQRSLF